MFLRCIGRDHRRCFGEAVPLIHRHPDRGEEALQLDVEQRAAADEVLHPSAEVLADLREEDRIEEADQGRAGDRHPFPRDHPSALYAYAIFRPSVNRASATGPFRRMPASMPLRKFFARAGTLIRKVGRTSVMFTGMFRSVSIGCLPRLRPTAKLEPVEATA